MNYKIVTLENIKLIGFIKEFNNENSYIEIPKFWNEIFEKFNNDSINNEFKKSIIENSIGEYALCIDDYSNTCFKYMIAGKYNGGYIPDGMIIYDLPKLTFAIFDCIGPNPETLQSINTRIFNEWLPNNGKYEMSLKLNLEWYSPIGNIDDIDYHSQIWIPVKEKINN